jgi:hypothetical protein
LRKKTQLRVEEKKKKKRKGIREHRTYANPAANPAAQTQTQRGMRKYNRSATLKKKNRSLNKQRELKEKNILIS